MLIDSHVALWVVNDSPRLGRQTRTTLAATATATVHVSSVTVLELTIKNLNGHLECPPDLPAAFESQGLILASYTATDAAAIAELPQLRRHDPFDRALVGQATARRWDFYTADRRILALGLPHVRDARE